MPTKPSTRGATIQKPQTTVQKPQAKVQKPQRIGILVLGMHRSGTSALTRVLNLLGCDLPNNLMGSSVGNEPGHWESQPAYQLNDRILESAGSNWHDWLEFNPGWFESPKADEFRDEALALLEAEFGNSRLFVLKDPRICRLAPFWFDVLERAGVQPCAMLPMRNPLEVAASLNKRNGFDPALGHLLWLRHVLEAEAASRGRPRFFTSYDGLLGGWGSMAERAQKAFDLKWPRLSDRAAGEIDGFLADRYRHHQAARESVVDNPALSSWLRESFGVLDDWARLGEKREGHATLDRIRREFNAAAPAFGRLVSAGKQASEQARKLEVSVAETKTRLGQVEAAAKEHEQTAQRRQQELAGAEQRLKDGEQKLTALEAELQKRASAYQAAQASQAEVQARLKKIEAEAAQWQEAKAQFELKLADAGKRLADGEQKSAALQADVERRSSELNKLAEIKASADRRSEELGAAAEAHRQREAKLAEELALAAQRIAEGEQQIATLRADADRRSGEINKLTEEKTAAERRGEELETAAAAHRQHEAEFSEKLADAGQRLAQAEKQIAEVQADIDRRTDELSRLAEEKAAVERRGEELEAAAEAHRQREAELADDVAQAGQRLAESEQQIVALQGEIASQLAAAERRERALSELRDRLAQTESALAQRRLETEQTAVELTATRAELRLAVHSRIESEKIAAGLHEHVNLLLADVNERNVAYRALEAASADRLRERDEALAAAGRSAEAHLLLETAQTRQKQQLQEQEEAVARLAAEKAALESELSSRQRELEAAAAERVELKANITERFNEIAILTKHLQEAIAGGVSSQERDALREQLAAQDKKLGEAAKDRDALRGRLAARDKEFGEVAKDRDALRSRLAARDKEFGDVAKDRDALRGKLAAGEKAHGEARQQVQALTLRKAALEADVSDRFAELATLTRMLTERDHELQRRAVQVEGFQTRVAEMEKRVAWRLTAPWHAFVDWLGVERNRTRRLVAASGLFDAEWYKQRYPDVANGNVDPLDHYMQFGWKEGRDPSEKFSVQSYVEKNPDIDPKKVNSLAHYIIYGRAEGRVI